LLLCEEIKMHKITCTTYFRGTNPSIQAEIPVMPVVSLKVTFLQDFYNSVSIAMGWMAGV
jgi:hypothetical protein